MSGPEAAVARLDRDLDRVLEILRRGDLAALPEEVAAIEAELASLASRVAPMPSAAELDALRRKLARNALCLEGAARGIRAARRRIAEVRGAASGHAAYDASGRRVQVAARPASLARRF
jgi:orotidine-5'-phosphate decarboxylase